MSGITSIYVTHEQSEAMAISDSVVIMNNGIIEQVGTPMEIYAESDNVFVTDFIGIANFVKVDKLVELKNGNTDIVLFGKEIRVQASKNCDGSNKHVCMIRPESIKIDPIGSYTAKVKSNAYFGPTYKVCIRNRGTTT